MFEEMKAKIELAERRASLFAPGTPERAEHEGRAKRLRRLFVAPEVKAEQARWRDPRFRPRVLDGGAS